MYDPKAGKLSKLVALWGLTRRRAAEGHLPLARQISEMALLLPLRGIHPPFYFSAGLFRRELSWSTKLTYLGNKRYFRAVDRIVPRELRILTNHKIVARAYLSTFGIPSAPFYGIVDPDTGVTFERRPLRSADDLAALFDRIDAPALCFKLISGLRGEGLLIARRDPAGEPGTVVLEPEGRRVTFAALWDEVLKIKEHMGYFCEGVIEQHPDAARFHPASVNTVRSWWYRLDNRQWELHAAVMRMGVGGSIADNLSRGGVGPRIDPETGRMHKAIDNDPNRRLFSEHPTTGVPIDGAVVPMWERVLELCRRTCDVLPMFRLLAIDVAIGVDGPLVTEIESTPDPHQVGFDQGMRPMIRALLADAARA